MEDWKARKSVSLLSAQPTEILGTKLKLPRQRALGMGFLFRLPRILCRRAWGLLTRHYDEMPSPIRSSMATRARVGLTKINEEAI